MFFDPDRCVDVPVSATDDDSVGFFFREDFLGELVVVDWDVTLREAAFFALDVVPASGELFCDNPATRGDFLVPAEFNAGNEGGPAFEDVRATASRCTSLSKYFPLDPSSPSTATLSAE